MRRTAIIPLGSWPRRMPVELAAAYCGETTVEAFIKRVGSEYPEPRVSEGWRRLWLSGRSRSGNLATRASEGPGRRRGSVTFTRPLPRFVRIKRLTNGAIAYYWELTGYYRKLGCTIPNEPLGTDYIIACGEGGNRGRAAALNALFEEWRSSKAGEPIENIVKFGTVDWLFREYKQTKAYLEKVSRRSRPDYERTMCLVTDLVTKKGDRIGNRMIRAITPVSADKIYDRIIAGPRGPRLRQGEKVAGLCARAWSVVHRFYPDLFNRDIPNPWRGVTRTDVPQRSNQQPTVSKSIPLPRQRSKLAILRQPQQL
jgi:hypothetical protein